MTQIKCGIIHFFSGTESLSNHEKKLVLLLSLSFWDPDHALVLFLGIYLLTLMRNLMTILWSGLILTSTAHVLLSQTPIFPEPQFLLCNCTQDATELPVSEEKHPGVGLHPSKFLFHSPWGTKPCLLSAMASDHHVAICHPLVYLMVINRPFCTVIMNVAWAVGFLIFLMNSLLIHNYISVGPTSFPTSAVNYLHSPDPTVSKILLAVSVHF